MTTEEACEFNAVKSALSKTKYFATHKTNQGAKNNDAFSLFLRTEGQVIFVIKRSSLTSFIREVKRITGILALEISAEKDKLMNQPKPYVAKHHDPSDYWWNKD